MDVSSFELDLIFWVLQKVDFIYVQCLTYMRGVFTVSVSRSGVQGAADQHHLRMC